MVAEHGAVINVAEQCLEISSETVKDRNEIFLCVRSQDLLDKTLDRFAVFVKE